jgi:transposase
MGRSRGGLTTKIHALVDGRGLPVGLHLSEGQASDCRKAIRARIESNGGFANIPAKRNRRKGFAFSAFLYRYRNLIERFFGKLKHARGLATRYDKRADNFLAAIKLFSARLWIATNESTA